MCLMVVGGSLIPFLSIRLRPSAKVQNISVRYLWPDASARVVESEVTSKLEALFNAVKGIENISSVSSTGWGEINISFKRSVNRDAARFEIAGLIRQSFPDLPEGVSYPQLSTNISGDRPESLLSYTINGSGSSNSIRKYVESIILPELTKIKGVNDVQIYGAMPQILEIVFSQQKANQIKISGNDIGQAINNYFRKELIGKTYLESGDKSTQREISLYLEGDTFDSLTWQRIPIRKVGNRVIYLTDLATIRFVEQTPSSYYRINGLNAINLVIYSEKNVNTMTVAESVQDKIESIKRNLKPGFSLLLGSDTTEFLSNEIAKVLFRSVVSLVFVIALTLLISRQFKYLLITALSIVSNLLISCILFFFFKIELQFYSMAGITVSLGIIVGNSIIMINHVRDSKNRKILLGIIASTLVTISSLVMIFILPEEQKENLVEFALVIIVNLFVSFAIMFYFIPALIDKLNFPFRKNRTITQSKRSVRFLVKYGSIISFNERIKWIYVTLLVMGFGLPVFLLPIEIKGDGWWTSFYNKTIGSKYINGNVRPIAEKILGGSLRLFAKEIFATAYYSDPSRTVLHVRGVMPEGCTVHQLNETIALMENFVSQFKEVESFQTSVYAYNNSDISIYFKPEYEFTISPYILKSKIEEKAISLGGADWDIHGVGKAFSNAINDGFKINRITLVGYNYDKLYRYAELLQERMSKHERVKNAEITGAEWWNLNTSHEFFIEFDKKLLSLNDISPNDYYEALYDKSYWVKLSPAYIAHQQYPVVLKADIYGMFTRWNFSNDPVRIGDRIFRLNNLGKIEKRKSGNDIHKYDQQYKLAVAYDFVGPNTLAESMEKLQIDSMKTLLPLGYSVKSERAVGWDIDAKTQYYFILLAIAIIYIICSILFESLLQPLAVIAMIPISFIGVFVIFYLFDINFDQGGYAAFIFLSGLSVSSGIYIVNDFNNFREGRFSENNMRFYLKAFNRKIVPLCMATLAFVLGLVSFVIDGHREVFWFAFSSGMIGGLFFSMIGTVIFLPLFLRLSINSKKSVYASKYK